MAPPPELAAVMAPADARMGPAGVAPVIRAGRDQPSAVAAQLDDLDAGAAARRETQEDVAAAVAAEHEAPAAVDEHLELGDSAAPPHAEAEVARAGAAGPRWEEPAAGRSVRGAGVRGVAERDDRAGAVLLRRGLGRRTGPDGDVQRAAVGADAAEGRRSERELAEHAPAR